MGDKFSRIGSQAYLYINDIYGLRVPGYTTVQRHREGPDANGATHTERGPGPSKTAPRHRPPPRPERRPEPTRVGPETTSRDHTRPRTNPGTRQTVPGSGTGTYFSGHYYTNVGIYCDSKGLGILTFLVCPVQPGDRCTRVEEGCAARRY